MNIFAGTGHPQRRLEWPHATPFPCQIVRINVAWPQGGREDFLDKAGKGSPLIRCWVRG